MLSNSELDTTDFPTVSPGPQRHLPGAQGTQRRQAVGDSRAPASQAEAGLAGSVGNAGGAPLHQPVQQELRHRQAVLPARFLHDEVQPPWCQPGRHAAGLSQSSPAGAGKPQPGFPQLHVRTAKLPERSHRHERRLPRPHGRCPG